MKINIIALLLLIFAGNSAFAVEIGGAHADMGLSCTDCHETDVPTLAPTIDQCLSCHSSYEELAAATKPTDPDPEDPESNANPHESHLGPVECADCHKTHTPSEFVCLECHMFDMEPK
jgi:fumarate reductase flavoprotein subunit